MSKGERRGLLPILTLLLLFSSATCGPGPGGQEKFTTSMGNTRRRWAQRSKLQFKQQQLLEVDEHDGAGII